MSLLDTPQFTLEVDRGPEWLFIRPRGLSGDVSNFAELVWDAMQPHFARRVVLELDDVSRMHSQLIGQIILLQKRVWSLGGTLRICGLSDANAEAIRIVRLDDRLPSYRNREDAVMGNRVNKPR